MRKRTKIGNSLVFALLSVLLVLIIPLFAEKDRNRPNAVEYAVIAGTVYRPPGFALPGAQIVIDCEEPDCKIKKMQAVTDNRGEFAMRVPPVPAKFRVSVKSKGYQPQQKTISVTGQERHDVSIVLEPETAKQGAK